MLRKAFRMELTPDHHAEYARRHNPIWPELEDMLRAEGVQNYSIFLDPDTDDLFAYVEVETEEQWEAIAGTEVCRRWWASMHGLMQTNPDGTPQTRHLREVFHLRGHGEQVP